VVEEEDLQALLRGDTRAKQTGSTGAHNHNVKGFHALSLVGPMAWLAFKRQSVA
jgi:hypothetical protein